MLLLVGLGNPGRQYALNRHNVGFLALDAIHRRHGFSPWRSRFSGETAEGTLGGEKVLLLKPSTYVNESGRSAGDAARFFKLSPADIVVIHDELDLPPGKIRMKVGGGHGGHNGLRSLVAHLGDGFRRLRIGIGHPGAKEVVQFYVLHDFDKAEGEWLNPLLDAVAEEAPLLATGKDSTFANRLHRIVEGDEQGKKKPKSAKAVAGEAESSSEPSPAAVERAAVGKPAAGKSAAAKPAAAKPAAAKPAPPAPAEEPAVPSAAATETPRPTKRRRESSAKPAAAEKPAETSAGGPLARGLKKLFRR